MADTFRGKVSVMPIVTLAADADSDEKDRIHHDVKKTLGGSVSWDFSMSEDGATPRWYYSTGVLTTSNPNMIAGLTGQSSTYTDGTTVSTTDKVRIAYIEHLGVDEDGNASVDDDKMSLSPQGNNWSAAYRLQLDPGEAMVLKFKTDGTASGVTVSSFEGDMKQNTAKVKVLAICDDVA